jgi:hypothetical protein
MPAFPPRRAYGRSANSDSWNCPHSGPYRPALGDPSRQRLLNWCLPLRHMQIAPVKIVGIQPAQLIKTADFRKGLGRPTLRSPSQLPDARDYTADCRRTMTFWCQVKRDSGYLYRSCSWSSGCTSGRWWANSIALATHGRERSVKS